MCFVGEYTRNRKKVIDLVPLSWIVSQGNKTYCFYPPKNLHNMIRKWVENSKDPDVKWEQSEVEILKYASKYFTIYEIMYIFVSCPTKMCIRC